jgi:hypothetical protein
LLNNFVLLRLLQELFSSPNVAPPNFEEFWPEMQEHLTRLSIFSTLEEQKKILGNALSNPFPPDLGTLDPDALAFNTYYYSQKNPGYLNKLTYTSFEEWIKSLEHSNPQDRRLGAVYNVTQAGKTHVILTLFLVGCFKLTVFTFPFNQLCYSYCLMHRALIIRFIGTHQRPTSTLELVCKNAFNKLSLADPLRSNIQLWFEFHTGVRKLVVLWLCAHFEFVKLFREKSRTF